MAQKFVENIFEKHIDWIALIQNDDNYKNILQVKIQKEFKVTPHYLEMVHDIETGYKMGVYLCIGQPVYAVNIKNAIHINDLKTFKIMNEYMENNNGKLFLFLGSGTHKIKRKAEQLACNEALQKLESFSM
jgi:dsRNA-specific ribonuclease